MRLLASLPDWLQHLLLSLVPTWRRWPAMNPDTIRADAMAGITGALVLVPQGVAFAAIAGMPPEYGLYAAMVPAVVAALWGSSWHLVSGPTTAISIVVFATIVPFAPAGTPEYVQLVLTLTMLVGIIQLGLGLARLGALADFVSHTVVVGFTSGAAVLIAASQAKNFFGVEIERGLSLIGVLTALARQWREINPWITGVAVFTIVVSVVCKRRWPKVPHMIAALVAGSALAAALNFFAGGVEVTGIRSIGALNVGFPPLSLPDVSPSTIERLLPIAFAVALLALTEAVSISRAIALRTQQRIDGNQEFVGQGLSNLVGSFFSGYASSGSFNRSGLNHDSGARTPLAVVFSAGFLLLIVLFLAPLSAYLPIAGMAGVLFVVAWGLIDFHHIRDIVRSGRQEAGVLIATLAATLTVKLEYAIYIGVLLSLLLYLNRAARPLLQHVVPGDPGWPVMFRAHPAPPGRPSLTVVRLTGAVFFGASNHLQEILQQIDDRDPERVHLLILAVGIDFIDYSGCQVLIHEAHRRQARGGGLYIAQVRPDVMDTLRRTGAERAIGSENLFPPGFDAVTELRKRLDPPPPPAPDPEPKAAPA